MELATMVIDQKGTMLDLFSKDVLQVCYLNGSKRKVGLRGLSRLIIYGQAQVSSGLLRNCFDCGVSVVLLPGRGQQEAVHCFPPSAGNATLRINQFKAHLDQSMCLKLAQFRVLEKFNQQKLCLNKCGIAADFSQYVQHSERVVDHAELLGVEGSGSAYYFSLWKQLWTKPWLFEGRNRRPPRDEVNSLLSLSYTLATSKVGQVLTSHGLDLQAGFLHRVRSNRPSLALDVLEAVRPHIDYWVWCFLSSGAVKPADFSHSQKDGVRLKKESRSVFYQHWYHDQAEEILPVIEASVAIFIKQLKKINYKPEEGCLL